MKRLLALLVVTFCVTVPLAPAPAQAGPERGTTSTVSTVPRLAGFRFSYQGKAYVTGADGSVKVPRSLADDVIMLSPLTRVLRLADGAEARFERWYGQSHLRGSTGSAVAAMSIYRPVAFRFSNLQGDAVARSDLGEVSLKSSTGFFSSLPAAADTMLMQSSRVVPDNSGLQVKDLYYTIQRVDVEGNNIVNRSQTKFFPQRDHQVSVPLLFFDASVRSRDALFGWGVSGTLVLEYPNGHTRTLPLDSDGRASLPGLPRGQYHLSVDGAGLKLVQPVAMSRPQDIDLKVFTWLDIATVAALGLFVAIGLLLLGRRFHRARLVRDRQPLTAAVPKAPVVTEQVIVLPDPEPCRAMPEVVLVPAGPPPTPVMIGPFVIQPDAPRRFEGGGWI